MRNPICLAITLWRSFVTGGWYKGFWVSGHDYREHAEPTPANVQVLVCRRCGKLDVGWSWEPIQKHPAAPYEIVNH